MTWTEGQGPQSIEIPLKGSNEVVEVFLDELPADPSEIQAILTGESAPLDLFLHFAIEYYRQKKFGEFKYLLEEGLAECNRRGDRKADVSLLTAFAAFNIVLGLGLVITDQGRDEAVYEEATMLLNEAEKHNQTDMSLLLRKGLLLLAQRKIGPAEYQLRIIINRDPDNIAAHAALGCTAFLSGNWGMSLNEFQLVLRKLPSSPTDIRMVIGHCMLRLGKEDQAQVAFERVLTMEPSNASALVSLAIIHLNRGSKNPAYLPKGMQLLKQAYDLDKTNPFVLFHLANHFFFKKNYAKALSLANSALANAAESGELKANALFMIAKIHHVQYQFDDAFNCYSEAVRLNPNLVLAQLGLGQVCLHRGDITFATGCFERVVELEKNQGHEIKDFEFWTMMGLASGAEELLKRASALGAKSFELLVAMASFYETKDPKEAVKAYKLAMEMDPERFKGSIGIVCNYSVMLRLTGYHDNALLMVNDCLERARGQMEMTQLLKFNKARLLEDMNRPIEAETIYKELAQINPTEITLHLRLGILCSRRGQHNEAAEHYKEAIGIEETNIDAWVLLASNHLRMKAITPARKAFERILKQNDRHDPFSLVALGNIYVEIGRNERRSTGFNENMRRALEFFMKALSIQKTNHIAANGVGIVLAELGRYKEAKEIFLQVKQADSNFYDASLNLAHCFVELGQFNAAVNAYEQLFEKTHGSHKIAALHLFMARAYYVQAKSEKNFSCFEPAISHLETASTLLPQDAPIKFNIALCQQEVASVMLKKGAERCTDEELHKAMTLVDSAHAAFTILLSSTDSGGGVVVAMDRSILEQRTKYCQSLRQLLQNRIEAIRARSSMRQAKLEAVKKEREVQWLEEHAKKQREDEQKRIEQERSEEIRRDLAAKLKTTEERIRAADELGQVDSGEEGSSSSNEEPKIKTRTRKSDTRKPRKRKTARYSEDDSGQNSADERSTMRGKRHFALSKELVSDSDQEATNNMAPVVTSDETLEKGMASVETASKPAAPMPKSGEERRGKAMEEHRRLVKEHREKETKLRELRLSIREFEKQYEKSENDIKALQSVGQIIGEVLKQLDNDRFIIKSSNGPRYIVGCRNRLDKSKLVQGTRVALDMTTLTIMRQLPREVDPLVYNMSVEDPGDVSFEEIGGLIDQIRELREVIELPLLNPELFTRVGVKAPKGVLLYGPPGTGKTLLARAVAATLDINFLKVVSSAIVDKYIGESARIIREMFAYARDHSPCIIFMDEIDAIGGRRFSEGNSSDREVQRTLMELLNQMDGFDELGQVKLIMATNRPDVLDPALLRPGRLDRKIEIPLPNEQGRLEILKIHSAKIAKSGEIDLEAVVKLSDGFNGADLRNVCTEAGMFAIREERDHIIQEDLMKATRKLIESKKLETKLDYDKI